MTGQEKPLRLAIVAGEESGDLLAADLVAALGRASGREIVLSGVGGRHLEALGLDSLFDPGEIALMGVSAILRNLPRLLRRIGETARAIVAAAPDCLVTVDSPAFNLRVARKVRRLAPHIPIVHYVCPSVWAWRPGRARTMRPDIDRVLCLLPFEPAELARLGGPAATYVGHRLGSEPGVLEAAALQAARSRKGRKRTLLVLPGSRRSEVRQMLGPFRETLKVLAARGNKLRIVMPTVPHVEALVRAETADWEAAPEISSDPAAKWRAFGEADAALACSGTVLLELALCDVPTISCYRFDPLARLASRLITIWSGALPNLIADRIVVPELYDRFVRPQTLARVLEALLEDTGWRAWELDGFAEVRSRMATERPAGELAAKAVLETIASKAR